MPKGRVEGVENKTQTRMSAHESLAISTSRACPAPLIRYIA